MSKVKVLPQYCAGLSAAFGLFCLGATFGWSSPMEQKIRVGVYGFDVSANEYGWLTSLYSLGAAFTCIPIGLVIGRIGRKTVMLLLIPLYLAAWLCLIFASSVYMLYAGRLMQGICGATIFVTIPLYNTEIAQLHLRGILGSLTSLMSSLGVLYVYLIGAFFSLNVINILCAVLPLIFGLFVFFIPESPVYLMQKGHWEAAKDSLQWLRGKNYDTTSELEMISVQLQLKTTKKSFTFNRVTLNGLSISVALFAFQVWSGVSSVTSYAESIIAETEIDLSAALCTIFIAAINALTSLIPTFIAERTGRRKLLLISAFFMALSTALLGVYFHLMALDVQAVEKLRLLPLVCICTLKTFFNIGFSPLPSVLMAELFADDIKNFASSISITCKYVLTFIVSKLFPTFRVTFGLSTTFFIFSVIDLIAFGFCFCFVPETRGKTIAEIQEILAGKSAIERPMENKNKNKDAEIATITQVF